MVVLTEMKKTCNQNISINIFQLLFYAHNWITSYGTFFLKKPHKFYLNKIRISEKSNLEVDGDLKIVCTGHTSVFR